MKKTIKYLDLTAPKFNLYINGKSCYRTIWGGIFHLFIVIALIVMCAFSLTTSIKRQSPSVMINSGYFSYRNFYTYPQPNNQTVSIEVSESITKYHSFVVSGSFYNQTEHQKLLKRCNRTDTTVTYCLPLSDMNFTDLSAIFISFPKCNSFNLKSEECIDYTDDEYDTFLNNESHPFSFKLLIDTVDIDLNNYYNKYITSNETDSIYLDKKRGTYFIINMKRVLIEENKEWIIRGQPNQSLSYLIDSKEQETTDDLSWNEISYSIMIKLDSKLSTIYTIRYETLFECFSFIGGLSSCISFFSIIKTIISSHFADIFMLNFNFINTKSDERRTRKLSGDHFPAKIIDLGINDEEELSSRQCSIVKHNDFEDNLLGGGNKYQMIQKDKEEEKTNLNNTIGLMSRESERRFRKTMKSKVEPKIEEKPVQILTYGAYLKYKIFKCCVKNQKKLYTNYKWIMDVNYLLKIYIQIHFLKTLFLSKKQVQLIDTISLLEKINVNSKFNIKNDYALRYMTEEQRKAEIQKELDKFQNNENPYNICIDKYHLTDEEMINNKLLNVVDYH